MSSDDGTYILALKDGYKVSQFHAIENLLNNLECVIMAFEDKILWNSQERASNYAFTLEEKRLTEYGVLIFDNYKDKTWEELKGEQTDFHHNI